MRRILMCGIGGMALALAPLAAAQQATPEVTAGETPRMQPGMTMQREAEVAGSRFLPPPTTPNPIITGVEAASELPQTPPLDLEALLSLATQNNPTLHQAQMQISATLGKALQAGLYPNPTFRFVAEQVGIGNERTDTLPGEYHAGLIQQRVVTAGKLRLSRQKYLQRAKVAEHLAMAQSFRVCNDVRMHYWRSLGAARILGLRQELLKTAEDAAVTARELYNLGQATRPAVRRADIALQRARLDVTTAENMYRQELRELAALVGVRLHFDGVAGNLAAETGMRDYDAVLQRTLEQSPEVLAALAKRQADRVTVEREEVEWIPDVILEGGGGYNYDAREGIGFAGLAVEIPLFDRNQGTIQQARSDLSRQQAEVRRTELDLGQRLAMQYRQYLTARNYVDQYGEVIVPEAKLAYAELLEAYQDNRVAWPDVLEAQHDLFHARVTLTERLVELRTNEVMLDGFLLHDGLMAAPSPTPPGHIDSVPKPR